MSRQPRTGLFTLIALAIPVLFFVLVEYGLRLAGYGNDFSLFIENPAAPAYLTPRPDAVKRYFADDAQAPSVTIETNFFRRQKPENGLRLFVQGGSTAAGFPFGYGASIAGMLDYRLKQSFPDRPVEVVNVALAAVNSYTMLDFSTEIITQQPDAILIYAGHNEFLGILGVGSAYAAANSRIATLVYLELKNLRLFQLLRNTYWRLRPSRPGVNEQKSRTFMAKVARHKNIAHGSPLFEQGLEQFRANVTRLIERYRDAGIPVFIATVGSNLSSQAPFSSTSVPAGELGDLAPALERLADVDGVVTAQELNGLQQLADHHRSADLYYQLGGYHLRRQSTQQARDAYTAARDHDLLRFRAPSEINTIISALAQIPGVYLVDANAALEAQAQQGIIGSKLMLEHLHPTLEGYAIIADAFYRRLDGSGVFGEFPHHIDSKRARAEIPVLDAEAYWGRAKVAALMADYPFTERTETPRLPPRRNWSEQLGFDFYEKRIGWLEMAGETFKRSAGHPLQRLKSAKILADALPHNAELSFQAGVTLIESARAIEAPRYLLRAIEIDRSNVNYQLALSHAYIEQKRFREAIPWIESVLKLDPNNRTALEVQRQYQR